MNPVTASGDHRGGTGGVHTAEVRYCPCGAVAGECDCADMVAEFVARCRGWAAGTAEFARDDAEVVL